MSRISNIYYRLCRYAIHKPNFSFLLKVLKGLIGDNNMYQFMVRVETYFLSPKIFHSNYRPDSRVIVVTFDDRRKHEGLADNLRAIVSIYRFCRLNNICFKVYYDSPFTLQRYLEPNEYNWLCDKSMAYSDIQSKDYICLSYRDFFGLNSDSIQKYFLNSIVHTKDLNVIRLYTNICCYDEFYQTGFSQLFKPSKELQYQIDEQLNIIGCPYISVSFRFAQLLGDLKDSFGEPLPASERESLISLCLNAVDNLHIKESQFKKILLTSDSTTFIDCAQKRFGFIYTVPGAIGHVGNDGSDAVVMKTFLDMYMISNASKVFMIRTEQMFRSGFAKRAAMVTNAPFEEIIL